MQSPVWLKWSNNRSSLKALPPRISNCGNRLSTCGSINSTKCLFGLWPNSASTPVHVRGLTLPFPAFSFLPPPIPAACSSENHNGFCHPQEYTNSETLLLASLLCSLLRLSVGRGSKSGQETRGGKSEENLSVRVLRRPVVGSRWSESATSLLKFSCAFAVPSSRHGTQQTETHKTKN